MSNISGISSMMDEVQQKNGGSGDIGKKLNVFDFQILKIKMNKQNYE